MDNAPPPNPSQFTPAKSTFVASSSTYTAARASVASFILVSRFHRGVSTPTPRPARILASHLQHRPRRPEPFPRARHSRLRPTAALSSVFPFVVARRPVRIVLRRVASLSRYEASFGPIVRVVRTIAHAATTASRTRAAPRVVRRRVALASRRIVSSFPVVAMCRPHPSVIHSFIIHSIQSRVVDIDRPIGVLEIPYQDFPGTYQRTNTVPAECPNAAIVWVNSIDQLVPAGTSWYELVRAGTSAARLERRAARAR